jgi:hypothetical protein
VLLLSLAVVLLGREGPHPAADKQGGSDLAPKPAGLPFEGGPPRPSWRGGAGKFRPGFGPHVLNGTFHLDGTDNGVALGIDGETTDDAVLVSHVAIQEGGRLQEFMNLDKVPAKYREVIPLILGNVARGRPIRGAAPP